jgi:ubiquinone/menaquinone biosynthesis C-methylase UbiE
MSGFQLAEQQAQRYEAVTSIFMSGSAALLATTAGVRPGDSVLDLACGTGLVLRHAVPLVGTAGRAVGTDVNPAMLSVARSAAGDAGARIEWHEAPAEAQPFPDASFDHVLCQQGLQFFPDPVAAIAECMRVLRPGGTLRATIWATPGGNPYIERQLEMLALLDESLVPSLQVAAPSDADGLMLGWARDAGCPRASIDRIEHVAPITDLGRFFLDQTASTPWGRVLAALPESERSALVVDMRETLAQYEDATGTHQVPFCSYRLTAEAG